MNDLNFTEKTLEETLERLTNNLAIDDEFTITFKNGKILRVRVIDIETTN